MGDKHSWEADLKYHLADEGFSYGLSNPVPLALLNCDESEHGAYISFTNGITRTIWLLSKGARSFPVEVYSDSAYLLEKHAGIEKALSPLIKAMK